MSGRFSPDDLLPLFAPRSIAVIGASGRKDRPGFDTLGAATCLGWDGDIYPVTPGYDEIGGIPCFPHISEIKHPVDLAIIAGAPQRMASDLEDALGAGAALLIGLSPGGTALMITLCASASYIAVPAALRLALPEARPAIYLPLSLGVTFPFNLTIGIPLYLSIAALLH